MNTVVLADRRSRLRAATDDLHRKLDGHVGSGGFLDTPEGYRDYLLRTLWARRSIERSLDASGAKVVYPAWPRRRISLAIERDLADLGVSEVPAWMPEKKVMGRGGVLGALYVLEGSSMGARIIARRVASLGAMADHGARHLALQLTDPKAFRAFLAILENARLSVDDEAECNQAAISTFTLFHHAYSA